MSGDDEKFEDYILPTDPDNYVESLRENEVGFIDLSHYEGIVDDGLDQVLEKEFEELNPKRVAAYFSIHDIDYNDADDMAKLKVNFILDRKTRIVKARQSASRLHDKMKEIFED